MALFSNLSERLNHIFSKLTNRGKLTELEIKQAMREIRVALLEADVNFMVVKEFVAKVSEKAVGEAVMESLTPGQQVVKIVRDELVELLGSTNAKLNVSSNLPTVILMCGLQGAGKTTMCGKLAYNLKSTGKKPLLVACDIVRPAAINQLQVVGKNAGVPVFERGTQKTLKTALEAIEYAKSNMLDTVIIDTAGRLHINEELMDELKEIRNATNPTEILLTVDAMTGQDAVNVAKAFNDDLDITGVILTKLDGDTRGGAALSIKAVTGKPIKFCGVGEKIGDLEPFHPDRFASRILGMGDVLSLIEKAQGAMEEKELQRLQKNLRENTFTLEDYLSQFENLDKMGDVNELLQMLPSRLTGKLKIGDAKIDQNEMKHNKAIIQSMTKYERLHPETLKASHKKRIADGSGTSIQQVNALLKQFTQTKELMKQFNGKKKGHFGF